MKTTVNSLSLVLSLLFALNVAAVDRPEYDNCLLINLKNAKLDAAAQLIVRACDETSPDSTFLANSTVVQNQQQKYNTCLLKNLGGVESAFALEQITAACQRKSER